MVMKTFSCGKRKGQFDVVAGDNLWSLLVVIRAQVRPPGGSIYMPALRDVNREMGPLHTPTKPTTNGRGRQGAGRHSQVVMLNEASDPDHGRP